MGIYMEGWKASAELRSIASKASVEAWDAGNTMQLRTNPDFGQKVLGIMVKLSMTPEIITSKAHNWLEDAGVIKRTTEEFALYREHILASLPMAADPAFVNIWEKESVDPWKIWKYPDREYFQEFGGLDIQIPYTISELEMRKAFTSAENLERLLAAKREGAITMFTLNVLEYELDAISKTLNQVEMPFQSSQIIEFDNMPADYEEWDVNNYVRVLKAVSGLRYNMTKQFTGKYNQAGFPTMESDTDNLVLLIRAEIPRNMKYSFMNTYHIEGIGFDMPVVEMPHFGGLTGFTPEYNATGQQTKPIADFTDPADPNADVFGIITTRDYFVRSDRMPVMTLSTPVNPRGIYISSYMNYSGGMNAIGYKPFVILKRKAG